jgi:hypothetical protein
LDEIRDILITQDNFTYTELQNLPDDTVRRIFDVKIYYAKGRKMAEKSQSNSKKPSKK